MIQSAMIFALGVFASGLVWLAFSVALVRRARRLTERRLLAGIAVRRAEFETERDELRARHAVQMHRLEREVSRVLDMATAHRLEADLKERDLVNARAELIADEEDFVDIERRLAAEREMIQDLERRHAEAGAALRAAQHALKLEAKRRASAEEALDEASILADQRRLALTALRSENDALRARLGEQPGSPVPFELDEAKLPRAVVRAAIEDRRRRTAATDRRKRGAAADTRASDGGRVAGAVRGGRRGSDPRPAPDRRRRHRGWREGRAAGLRRCDAAHACRGSARLSEYRRAGRAPHRTRGERRGETEAGRGGETQRGKPVLRGARRDQGAEARRQSGRRVAPTPLPQQGVSPKARGHAPRSISTALVVE